MDMKGGMGAWGEVGVEGAVADAQAQEDGAALAEDSLLDGIDYARRIGFWLRAARHEPAGSAKHVAALKRARIMAEDLRGLIDEHIP